MEKEKPISGKPTDSSTKHSQYPKSVKPENENSVMNSIINPATFYALEFNHSDTSDFFKPAPSSDLKTVTAKYNLNIYSI